MARIEPLAPFDVVAPAVVARARGLERAAPPSSFATAPVAPRITTAMSDALRQIVLPLPDTARSDDVRESAWRADLGPSLDLRGDLGPAVRDAAQDLLRTAAEAQDVSPARFAATFAALSPGEQPSRNGAGAHSHLRTMLPGHDGGDHLTLDLHLSRIAESGWEAALFDRAAAAPGGAFPYREPPVAVATLQLDGRAALLMLPDAHRMLQVVPVVATAASPAKTFARMPALWLALPAILAVLLGLLLLIRTSA